MGFNDTEIFVRFIGVEPNLRERWTGQGQTRIHSHLIIMILGEKKSPVYLIGIGIETSK